MPEDLAYFIPNTISSCSCVSPSNLLGSLVGGFNNPESFFELPVYSVRSVTITRYNISFYQRNIHRIHAFKPFQDEWDELHLCGSFRLGSPYWVSKDVISPQGRVECQIQIGKWISVESDCGMSIVFRISAMSSEFVDSGQDISRGAEDNTGRRGVC